MATGLLKGCFGLAELEADALGDKAVLALTAKVDCHADPESKFPEAFSGGVRVRVEDGRELVKHIAINEGSGHRALSRESVIGKFMGNAAMRISHAAAKQACEILLELEKHPARTIADALRTAVR